MKRRNMRHAIIPSGILAFLIVARLSCTALSNVPLLTMTFTFIYGVLFCFFCLFFHFQHLNQREFMMLVFGGFYSLYSAYVCSVVNNDLFSKDAFNSYVLFFLLLIYIWLKRVDINSKRIIVKTSLVGFCFTFLYSIPKLIIDPELSRKSAAAIISRNSPDTLNAIGGFDTVYGGIIVIALIYCTFKGTERTRRFRRILLLGTMLVGIVFIVMSSFGTAAVILALLLVMGLYNKNRLFSVLVIFSLLLFFIFRKPIGYTLMRLSLDASSQFSSINRKTYDIGYILYYNELTGTLAGNDGRVMRMMWSWNAFLSNPVFGSLLTSKARIGNHCEVLDTLARFGLVGFIPIILLFLLLFKETRERQTSLLFKKNVSICYTIYFATAVLNPALYAQQILPLFILLPFVEETLVINNGSMYDSVLHQQDV